MSTFVQLSVAVTFNVGFTNLATIYCGWKALIVLFLHCFDIVGVTRGNMSKSNKKMRVWICLFWCGTGN